MRATIVVFALMLFAPQIALSGETEEKVCKACNGTGIILCKTHTYKLRGKFQLICSQCKDTTPKCCGGLGWTPCTKCDREGIKQAWDRELESWKAESKHQDGYTGKYGDDIDRAATRHFRIQGKLSHREFHVLGDKLERCFAYFQTLQGGDVRPGLQWDRCLVSLYEKRYAYESHVDAMIKQGNHPNVHWLQSLKEGRIFHGPDTTHPHYIACRAPYKGHPYMPDDEVEHSVIHSVGHMCLETYKEQPAKELPAWFREGFGGHCETIILRYPNTYCLTYGGAADKLNKSLWRDTIRKALKDKKLRTFEELSQLQIANMNGVDWAHSIAIINFLTREPEKFAALTLDLKNGTDSVRAIQTNYGLTPEQLRAKWLALYRRGK